MLDEQVRRGQERVGGRIDLTKMVGGQRRQIDRGWIEFK
ncbi:hypothetical protein Rumeso_00990 [Rubellimicrobium mesophilum DSM 19309]|uniref:Uncharacterized protein n=1 Tax=Rubellimicrobium mesophilum DSM 19309 TaxID=442562 RepID=A0A017HST5_9RHOB|nr:hypothetical protein Rumeso_00990 [Rubellimicrobium mesophilum DSM 19309]